MSIKPWICNGSRTIVKDRWIDLHADDCALPDGTKISPFYVNDVPDFVYDIDEENIALANDDYTAMASVILEGLGGSANVKSIDNCITRLRLEINDDNKIDEAKIKSSGAAGIIRPGKGNIQVIIGPKVQFVADEMEKLCK